MSYLGLNRMKLIIFFTITVFLGAVFLYLWKLDDPVPTVSQSEDPLVLAFEESGAQFQELTAQSWGKVGSQGYSLEELNGFYEDIIKALGKGSQIEVTDSTQENYIGLVAAGKTAQGYDINITLQTIKDSYEDDETYLIVDLHEALDSSAAESIRKTADSCFKALGTTGETSVLITGYFEEVISSQAKQNLGKAIFSSVGGSVLEAVDSGSYISQSGYCPGLPRSVTSNGKEINLQIALFDNELENQTGIFIGTPLIFSEY